VQIVLGSSALPIEALYGGHCGGTNGGVTEKDIPQDHFRLRLLWAIDVNRNKSNETLDESLRSRSDHLEWIYNHTEEAFSRKGTLLLLTSLSSKMPLTMSADLQGAVLKHPNPKSPIS
jgi:hypothetical protein